MFAHLVHRDLFGLQVQQRMASLTARQGKKSAVLNKAGETENNPQPRTGSEQERSHLDFTNPEGQSDGGGLFVRCGRYSSDHLSLVLAHLEKVPQLGKWRAGGRRRFLVAARVRAGGVLPVRPISSSAAFRERIAGGSTESSKSAGLGRLLWPRRALA